MKDLSEDFYEKLYMVPANLMWKLKTIGNCILPWTWYIPKVQNNEKEYLDERLQIEYIANATKALPTSQSPGGLPVEFYNYFAKG